MIENCKARFETLIADRDEPEIYGNIVQNLHAFKGQISHFISAEGPPKYGKLEAQEAKVQTTVRNLLANIIVVAGNVIGHDIIHFYSFKGCFLMCVVPFFDVCVPFFDVCSAFC